MARTAKADVGTPSASALIDRRIDELADWRGETLARLRALIRDAAPDIVEEWKWANPVSSCAPARPTRAR